MSIESLIAELEEELPVKRQVNVEGWPRPVWVWKITLEQIQELSKLPRETSQQVEAYGLKLLSYSLGDESAPAGFATARSQNWLRRQALACLELIRVAQEFNELAGPSEERKKKSRTAEENSSSSCAETSDSDTLSG